SSHVVQLEGRYLERRSTQVLFSLDDGLPLSGGSTKFMLGRVLVAVEESALRLSLGGSLPKFLGIRSKHDIQPGLCVGRGVLGVGGRGVAEGCSDLDVACDATCREWNGCAQVLPGFEFPLVDQPCDARTACDHIGNVVRELPPSYFRFVVSAALCRMQQQCPNGQR